MPLAVRMYLDGSYGFAAPKLCGRIGTIAKAVPHQSCTDMSDGSYVCVAPKMCGRIGTIAMALPCQSCAAPSSAQSSRQARKLWLRLALS